MTDHIGETNKMVLTDQELNLAVAKKLGWKFQEMGGSYVPSYCIRIEAAWEIVEWFDADPSKRGWPMLSRCDEGWMFQTMDCLETVDAIADTAPRAICEAFLKLP